jgi:putative lipase involved disintegration of autophagic bodies
VYNKNEYGYDGDYLINKNLLIKSNQNNQELQSLAVDVIFGLYGNGTERKDKLGNKFNEVQKIVNQIYKIVGE